jgi:hypothetical protein
MTLGAVLLILIVIIVFVVIGCWISGKTFQPPYQTWAYALIGVVGLIMLLLLFSHLMGADIFSTHVGR